MSTCVHKIQVKWISIKKKKKKMQSRDKANKFLQQYALASCLIGLGKMMTQCHQNISAFKIRYSYLLTKMHL